MITFTHKGSFKNTERFFNKAQQLKIGYILEKYGPIGVNALSMATPKDTGETANSWTYSFSVTSRGYKIEWFNMHVNNGAVVALLIQYGHGTGTGGYVSPIDYVNPAMKPIFNKIGEDVWKEVTGI